MKQTAVNFFSSNNMTLEGILAEPTGDEIPEGAGNLPGVVLCAPEPHLGGTMQSPVIEALLSGMTPRGYLTFRFNYRGVGDSSGDSAPGEGQAADALSALEMLREWPTVDKNRIGIVGYSYGASVALHVAAREPEGLRAVVAVSPLLDVPLLGIPTDGSLSKVRVPVRFLIGGNDGMTTPGRLGEWVEGMDRADVTALTLEGADRAWQTSRQVLAAAVATFFDAELRGDGGSAREVSSR